MVVLVAGVIVPVTGTFAGKETTVVEIVTPRSPTADEAVELQVTTRALPRDADLSVLTEQGEILGSIASYGPSRGSTTITIPVPKSAITNGRLRLRLEVIEPGAPARPPLSNEVERLELVIVAQSK